MKRKKNLKLKKKKNEKKNFIYPIILIIIITFCAFFPSLNNGFVQWDDHVYITENSKIKET